MAAKKKPDPHDPNSRVVAQNRRARHDYDIVDEIECGIVLSGSEVKSIRDNRISIEEAYARVEGREVWLHNCDIQEYPQATYLNHERKQSRKLLMNRREIRKFAESAMQDGMTLIPLSVYFTNGRVKINLGMGKGRKLHDKRDRLKKAESDRSIREGMHRRL